MKQSIIFSVLLVATLFLTQVALAQNKVYFRYDGSGNRELRSITLPTKSATLSSGVEIEPEVIESNLENMQILVYPNPTTGQLRIDIMNLSEVEINLGIYDSRGRLLLSKKAKVADNVMDLSSYPSGLYILVIKATEDKREWKIIKE